MADNLISWLEARAEEEAAKGDQYALEGLHMVASERFAAAEAFREVAGRLGEFLPSLSPSPVPERWRSPAARELAAAVRKAGGTVERAGTGRIRVTGPRGTITLQEPSGDTRRDLRRDSAAKKIAEATGLDLAS